MNNKLCLISNTKNQVHMLLKLLQSDMLLLKNYPKNLSLSPWVWDPGCLIKRDIYINIFQLVGVLLHQRLFSARHVDSSNME